LNIVRAQRLKKQWINFKQRTGASQQLVSNKLGWSKSFFGKIINGNNECSDEHLIKICNFLDIPPTLVDPNFTEQSRGQQVIARTTSGSPPPAQHKMFRPYSSPGRVLIWNDKLLPIKQKGKILNYIPPNTTLFCSENPLVGRSDANFPECDTIFWLICKGGSTSCVKQQQPPKAKGAEVLRIVAVAFV